MIIEYKTYYEIPEEHRNIKGFAAVVPMDAAGIPYTIYEYDADAPRCDMYYGLSPREISKLLNARM